MRKNPRIYEWSREENDRLIQGYADGVSVANLAADLRRTSLAVNAKLVKLRKEGRLITPYRYARKSCKDADSPPLRPDSITDKDLAWMAYWRQHRAASLKARNARMRV
jgi:hypothetical protein